jgi:hypothetical protein
MTHRLNPDGSVPGESPAATERRRAHERQLNRVGVGSDAGQRLLAKWAQERRESRDSGDRSTEQ